MRIAVFPGSFDPITIGHEDIVRRALPMFDKIIVAIGRNTQKKNMFDFNQRADWISEVFMNDDKVQVAGYEGLTIDFCREQKANFILRGLRSSFDFEYEKAIGQMNHSLASEIETVILLSLPQHSHISSTIIRDIILHKGDVNAYVPKAVSNYLNK